MPVLPPPVPAVIFPDVELVTLTYLRRVLTARPEACAQGVYFGTAVPSTRRDRMVTVRRDGGPRLDLTRETARLGVNVWGHTDQEAGDLARLVCALMPALADGLPVLAVTRPTGPSPVADDSGQPLRYLVFELTVRGAPLT
jgi:hypothetical protein